MRNMPKNKILIYLLSTTLVLPTLVSPNAYADTPKNDTTAKTTTTHGSKNLMMLKLQRILQVKILMLIKQKQNKKTMITQANTTLTIQKIKH